MDITVKDKNKISPPLVFFLVHSMQIGVQILVFQADVVKFVGNDMWILILCGGLVSNIIIFIIYQIMKHSDGNLVTLHKRVFGKYLGNVLSLLVLLYYLGIIVLIMRLYIEVIQVWVFPQWTTWSFALIFVIIIYYINSHGFRTVVGISFFGVIIPLYLVFTAFYPVKYAHFTNLLPIWDHSLLEMYKGALSTLSIFIGFSTLLFYYPFIKEPRKSQKWAHLGSLLSLFLYMAVTIISLAYYGSEQLRVFLYPTLGIWKIVELPFAERFEYIGIASWLFVTLPNMCIPLWCIGHGMKQIFHNKHHFWLIVSLIIIFIANIFFKNHEQITVLSGLVSKVGIAFVFGYIPILWAIQALKRRLIQRNG